MCYNVSYLTKRGEKYAERYGIDPVYSGVFDAVPDYYFLSGFVHPALPLIRHDGVSLHSWGLIPPWVKDETEAKERRKFTLNAIGEEVFTKPSYRSAIKKQRGILPVTGFYEWRDVNKKKYPYFIRENDSEVTSLGCVYEEWTNKATGEIVKTFSILTTAANPLMEKIHNTKKRMPLMLSGDDAFEWIDPNLSESDIKKLIQPFDEKYMQAHTVSTLVNSAKNHRNIAEAMEETEYSDLPAL